MQISVVIPVLNESEVIEELVRRVKLNVESITSQFEIIIIDDGSMDETWNIFCRIASYDKRIKGLKLSRNFGQHFAITSGLRMSKGEFVVVMDGDLQDKPEVIPDLFHKAQEGFDVVFVARKNRPERLYYIILQKIFYLFLRKLSGIDFDSRMANYSIISKKVVQAFNSFPEYARFYASTIKWLGFKSTTTYILADHGTRYAGRPSYTLKKRFKLATDVILSFSERPLNFAIGLGLSISTLSFFVLLYLIIGSYFFGFSVIGWPSLISSVFFIGGINLIVAGIIGVYIGRIFIQVKNRPLYIVEEKIGFNISET
jgi:glycosyltransferase involved in cell wall biosynthesis